MKVPSRQMPPYIPERMGVLGWLVAAVALGALGYSVLSNPWLLFAAAVIVALAAFEIRRRQQRLRILIEERNEESLCTFARQFDKDIDTWVVRAVHEQLSNYISPKHPFPLRAEDRLIEDLELDEEDLDLDLCNEISQRTGRALTNVEENPLYGRVHTVGDLVRFFSHQPHGQSNQPLHPTR